MLQARLAAQWEAAAPAAAQAINCRTIKFRLCTIALAIFAAVASAAAQTPPAKTPVEAFGLPVEIGAPALSPDGKHLALIQAVNGRPIVVVVTLDPAGVKPLGIPISDGYIVGVRWANNSRMLITVNVNRRYFGDNVNPWYRTFAMDAKGQNMAVMFSDTAARNINYSTGTISDLAVDDPAHIYMPIYDNANNTTLQIRTGGDNELRLAMFRVNVNDGTADRVVVGGPNTRHWIMDGKGNVIGRIDTTMGPLTDHLYLLTNGEWKEVESSGGAGRHGIGIAGLTEDGASLVMLSERAGTGIAGVVTRKFADGKREELYFNPNYDLDTILADHWTGRVVGVSYTADQTKDVYFNPGLKDLQAGLEKAFPGNSVHAVSWDSSRKKVVVAVDGPYIPRSYYLLDRSTGQASFLLGTYVQLTDADLSKVEPYPYKARDGLDIPAYLTMPRGKTGKNLPVIVMPHGGPVDRDAMGFDWLAQFLANRGYAVLQPNFRGSSGYGARFEEAGYGQWGLKMQDDVSDGVKKLIADGIADPKRICIVGWSYGGYAALAGAAFTPDLYACAASIAGVSDLSKLMATEKQENGANSAIMETWKLYIGADSDRLEAASPAKHADKVNSPVLLIHGDADSTVRIDQSEAMEKALHRLGKKVTFVRLEKVEHHALSSDSRVKILTELEKFLKENIGD